MRRGTHQCAWSLMTHEPLSLYPVFLSSLRTGYPFPSQASLGCSYTMNSYWMVHHRKQLLFLQAEQSICMLKDDKPIITHRIVAQPWLSAVLRGQHSPSETPTLHCPAESTQTQTVKGPQWCMRHSGVCQGWRNSSAGGTQVWMSV